MGQTNCILIPSEIRALKMILQQIELQQIMLLYVTCLGAALQFYDGQGLH